jgi:predicted patatin/cPLA2 family phospholipase
MRSRMIIEKYVGDKRYVSKRNLLRHRSAFGYDFIFKTIPGEYIFWDRATFDRAAVRLLTGATDCNTGQTVWFEKEDMKENFDPVIASCSVPLLSRIVRYRGMELLDGGTGTPIPIEKSVRDGNRFHVVVMTRNPGYVKPPFNHQTILRLAYRKYPRLIEAMLNRHEVYRRQVEICERLERDGKALIIRPLKPLKVDRLAADIPALLALHDEGMDEGRAAVSKLAEKF